MSTDQPAPLRVLLLANDGRSGGHVVRALAVARALEREAVRRRQAVRPLLATTSEADGLLSFGGIPFVKLPGPDSTADTERRELATRNLLDLADDFRPDVLVTDTFPCGPHLEAAPLLEQIPTRVLVRRSIRPDRAGAPEVASGLSSYRLTLLPADPLCRSEESGHPIPAITLLTHGERFARRGARHALGLRLEDRIALLSCGAGGDPEGERILEGLARILADDGRYKPFVASGPLASKTAPVPLQRYLAAFDLAILAAGYNSAHEAAAAALTPILFARPRAFDDQAARAERFRAAGLALALTTLSPASVRGALDQFPEVPRRGLDTSGADAAARAIWDLVL